MKLTIAEATKFQVLELDNKDINKAAIEAAEDNLKKRAV